MSRDVAEGEPVREGDCIAQLDHRVHNEKLELARVAKESLGELQIAEAEFEASQTRLRRLEDLAKRRHATEVEVLQAREALRVAQATIQRAKDRLSQQEADYQRLKVEADQYFVKAPFDGVVVEFSKQVGEYVGPGESVVCTLADISQLSVEFLVPRAYRDRLAVGDEVSVVFTVASRVELGRIIYVSPFPNGETNTYKMKVLVDNESRELSAGERCLLQEVDKASQPNALQTNALQSPAHQSIVSLPGISVLRGITHVSRD